MGLRRSGAVDRWVLVFLGATGIFLSNKALAQLELPQWTDAEWEKWQRSTPPLGDGLFPGTAYAPEDPVEPEPGDVPEEVPQVNEVVPLKALSDLPAELVDRYFPSQLHDRVLDPQALLTQARLDGILHFLDYHFREARSAIHIMILKPEQRIPEYVDVRKMHQKWFGDSLSVLVIYSLSNPEMSRLIFGAEAERRLDNALRVQTCFSAINEAMVVANAEDQLERFLTELSRRLEAVEEVFHGQDAPATMQGAGERGSAEVRINPETVIHPEGEDRPGWLNVVAIAAFVGMAGGALVVMRKRASPRAYYFPETKRRPRLGCPVGGGHRLVVTFGSPVGDDARDPEDTGPPSSPA